MAYGLVEEVANRCPKWASENERGPKKTDPRDIRPVVSGNKHRKASTEDQCATFISEAASISQPIAKCGAECLRERYRRPIETLDLWSATVLTEIVRSDQYQMPSTAIRQANNNVEPPV